MYSEDDINAAVSAGALTPEAARSFRDYVSRARVLPRQSEENFKLLNSFNDIFVTVGIVILLVAMGAIGQALAGVIAPNETWFEFIRRVPEATEAQEAMWASQQGLHTGLMIALSGAFVAATAWPLSEFFTRTRRMALPSIILLLGFVGGAFALIFGIGGALGTNDNEAAGAVAIVLSGVVAAGAAWFHWKRFQVPITVAAAVGVAVLSLLLALGGLLQIETDQPGFLIPVLIAGLAVFGLAMRWDVSDRERITRRSDVAFWLHLLAAPLIAHSIFALIGINSGDTVGLGAALAVLAVYLGFALVALAVDRRALLVSALAYVLVALSIVFEEFGAVELGFALTALVIGSALLALSAFWQSIRIGLVSALPDGLQTKLPEPQRVEPLAPTPSPA